MHIEKKKEEEENCYYCLILPAKKILNDLLFLFSFQNELKNSLLFISNVYA